MEDRPADLQAKVKWCEWGEERERDFLEKMWCKGVGIYRNPHKSEDKFVFDAYIVLPADIKTVRTKYLTADRYGVDPKTAISINEKDIERYRTLAPTMMLILDVKIPDHEGIHIAPLGLVLKCIEKGRAKRHEYRERVGDRLGNAKASYVFDCTWFPQL